MIFIVLIMLILLIASIYDIKNKAITVPMLVIGAVTAVICGIFQLYFGTTLYSEIVSLFPGALVLAIAYLTREQIGFGDGFMILFLGPVFGLVNVIIGISAAFILSALFSAALLIFKKAGKKSKLPFLPFLTAGMGVVCAICSI
ncbi:MAG: prepilin peptidase [Butyrivibrio sp.]|uniref:prepilin peptidase n=1 Tax=Butyrivibrio sp. TaxID=28121 RepID=UPI0025F94B91|nr:prepilin peptidase [Butyrivibrio sp.]MCR5772035.1 prepilin peptidase [Butyrivibrio sp.]